MIRVHTLGTALIEVGSTQITPVSTRKFALMLYLSAESERRVSREALQELIFPDQTEKNARHSLRELVYQLRQRDVPLDSNDQGIALPRRHVRLDYAEIVDSGRPDAERLRTLESAGFLPEYAPNHSEAFGEWLERFRARVTFELCKALLGEMSRARSVGDWLNAERMSRACLALDPLNEAATLALAESLALNGSKLNAVRLLDSYMAEVGGVSPNLRLSAAILKSRLGERRANRYRDARALPFVGREHEMSQLRDHFASACAEACQCILIAGEPGIGKSRLASEFAAVAALDGAHVERASARPHDSHRPMSAFIDLVGSLMSVPGALGCSPESMNALRRLTSSPESSPLAPGGEDGDSEIRQSAIVGAISDLIDAISAETPLVLIIEDAHWLDRISLRSFGDLVSAKARTRFFVLLTTRDAELVREFPAYVDRVGTIAIQGLASGAAAELTERLIRQYDFSVDDDMRRWIEATAAGNPMYIESLLTHYVGTGERFAVPPTLLALTGRRLDSISPHAQTILQFCVLLGKHCDFNLLEGATRVPRVDLLPAVAELERARLIQDVSGRILPAHPLIAEAAEKRLSPTELRLAHQCIATVLEQLAENDASAALAWECAEHWLRGRESTRATAAVRKCATHAIEIGRPRAAAEMLLRATELPLQPTELAAIAREAVLAADAASEPDLVFRAMELCRTDDGRRVHDDIEFAEFRAMAGSYREAGDLEEKLLGCVLADEASPDHRVSAATSILKYCHIHGKSMFARHAINGLPDEVMYRANTLNRLEFQLIRHAAFGDPTDSIAVGSEILALSGRDKPITRLRLQLNVALAFWRANLVDQAVETVLRCFEDATACHAHRLRLTSAVQAADYFFDLGRDELGHSWLNKAVAITVEVPSLSKEFNLLVLVLELLLEDGNAAGAATALRKAIGAGVFEGSALRARWQDAFEFRLRQIGDGRGLSDDEIQDLLVEPCEVSPMTGIRDLEIATACRALLDRGRADIAANVVKTYCESGRRSKSPYTHPLRRAIEALEQERAQLKP